MIFIALQFEHGVLRRALLALCDLQLVARFGKLTLGVLGGLGGKVELFGKAAAPRRQLAQLGLRGSECLRCERSSRPGHRAAAVQNLPSSVTMRNAFENRREIVMPQSRSSTTTVRPSRFLKMPSYSRSYSTSSLARPT